MNYDELKAAVSSAAKERGFRRRSILYWREVDDLTQAVHLQRNPWGPGVYVNTGAIPTRHVVKATPPGTGYWAVEIRPTNVRGRFLELFHACETREIERVALPEFETALVWWFDWLDHKLAPAHLRAAALDPESWWAKRGLVTVVLRDWARGRLRKPAQYYAGTPYYRGVDGS